MRLIGIIGGLSWESTAEYYRILNQEVARREGPLASARVLLSSVDFSFYAERMEAERWDEIREALIAEAARLARGGAEGILVATNTMHLFAEDIERASGLRLLHIADSAGQAARASGATRVGLMGTSFTMEKGFYRDRLREGFGIEAIVPPAEERIEVHRVIMEELCAGKLREESRKRLQAIAVGLARAGASGIILGCTELPLIMKDGEAPIPYWDTTHLHAIAAVDFMLG